MATLPPEEDQFQQDPTRRNAKLAQLLNGGWLGENIKSIRRDPIPTNPPNPAGPKDGRWIAETA